MLIADTNQFHPLVNGPAYAAGRARDGTPYSVIILRATYSTYLVDTWYAASVAQARAGHLLVGHYGYLAAGDNATVAGTFFGQTVKAHGGVLPGDTIWCDCEEGAGDQSARVQAFLAAAHTVLHDDPADEGIYSGASFYAAHLGLTPKGYHRWIAAYGVSSPPPYGEPLWQFEDNGTFPGCNGPNDGSIFNGTLDQFRALFISAPPPAPAPSPGPSPTPIEGTTMQELAQMPINAGGEGWAVFDGGINSDPGTRSLSPAIPYAKFVAATAYGPDPVHDSDWGPIHIDQQNRNGWLYLHARNAPPGPATTVATIAYDQ